MAKSRHSAALFEVITRSRPLSRPNRPGFLQWIANWFKPHVGDSPEPIPTAATVAGASVERSPLPEPVAPSLSNPIANAPAVEAGAAARSLLAATPREFHFHLSYRGTLIAVFALLTMLAVAFVAGMRAAGPRPALADKTGEQMREESPRPGVLALRQSTDGRNGSVTSPGARTPPTTRSAHGRDRVVGLNYIIIQSYPDEKTAREAEKLLTDNGLECSAEKGLPGWGPPSWWSVVALDGYARISSPECQAQMKKIKDLSDKFARRGSFKAFDPKPYKWKATAVAHAN